jgi:hypothetical protein
MGHFGVYKTHGVLAAHSYSSTGSTVFGTTFWANYLGLCKSVQLRHDAEE